MKNTIKAFIVASSLAAVSAAHAGWGGATMDFNVTNYLTASANTYNGWPTNSAGVGVGQPVNISQFDNLVLNVKGMLGVSQNAGSGIVISLTMLSSSAGPGGPQVTMATNLFQQGSTQVITYNDWQTGPGARLQTFNFYVPPGVTNGYVNFAQDIPSGTLLADSTWIGITNLTVTGLGTNANQYYTNGFITNLDVSITGKAVVKPWSF